jgi:DNA-binding NarL/FixJ family response regulator
MDGLHEQLEGARFDVVVLDTRLPAPVSLEYIAGLRKKLNGAKVMLLLDEPRAAFQQEAVKEIVNAAVLKSMPLGGFLKVFELVLAGQKFVPPLPAGEEERVIDAETNVTREEQIVLSAAARGLTDKEIAVETNYPLNRVKHNLMRVRAKLKARDRTQAAIQARERGIIEGR